jgi:hypothetical protein
MRIFGQFYNDAVKPQDPFEFMDLLEPTNLVSIERNRLLARIAQRINKDPQLTNCLKSGIPYPDPEFNRLLDLFTEKLGITTRPTEGASNTAYSKNALVPLLLGSQTDLFAFKKGEVLLCDALDPDMTFIVPLSSGIVERREGYLFMAPLSQGNMAFLA